MTRAKGACMTKGWIWKRCKTGEEATATATVAWGALTPVCCSVCLGEEEEGVEEEGAEAFQVA